MILTIYHSTTRILVLYSKSYYSPLPAFLILILTTVFFFGRDYSFSITIFTLVGAAT